jgi:UDP-N-acetylmuramoyl-tripeptide--D-alanyl-D-alanine ligase
MNLSIAEITGAVKGEILNNSKEIRIKNISTDSREDLHDSLFVALKGDIRDGHDFTAQAVEKGAAAVIINKDYVFEHNGVIIIKVENTGQAFLDLAKYYKSLFDINLTVGITGSVGKTTVKEFMHAVISQKYKARKTAGNFNNEIGLPKTIFGLQEDERALVLEMGMNHLGEIARLSKTGQPDIGVINNIGTSHIENLGTREGIKKAKFELLDGMSSSANIILNADEPLIYSEKGKTGKREIFFGIENKDADFTAVNIRFDYENNESYFEISGAGFTIPAVGVHNVHNAIPAYIAGKLCGLSDGQIQAGFNNFENAKMRQNIYAYHGITIIDDCYNASLESVKAALAVLSQINNANKDNKNGKKIAVLADILECGDFADEIHENIGKAAVENHIDTIFVYGEKSRKIFEVINIYSRGRCFYFEDKAEIAGKLFERIKLYKDEATILFKASRGMAMETVLEDFKKLF